MALLTERPPKEAEPWRLDKDQARSTGQLPAYIRVNLVAAGTFWQWRPDLKSQQPYMIGETSRIIASRDETGGSLRFEREGTGVRYWLDIGNTHVKSVPEDPLSKLQKTSPQCAERLELLASLEPNWDGYGANGISEITVERCANLLYQLFRDGNRHSEQLFIAPLADGGIELEWDWESGTELMLVIPPSYEPIEYLSTTVEQSSGEETEDEGLITDQSGLQELLGTLSD